MRRALIWIVAALGGLAPLPLSARDIAASAPVDISVTIYRAPTRNGGAIQLGSLGGFAVVTETRTVTLPAGESRLRFEGVVDGIIPESAIVSGLPGGVIEKNRDAALLSPSALARASVGKQLLLRRTDPATGKPRMIAASIRSATEEGVVLETADGTEALACSGMAETFAYSSAGNGLSAQPTLSVKTRSSKPITTQVTLTYLAEGFDWSASYTAHIAPDGKSFHLGGWITLANGNSVSLRDARLQIVAGGLNRAYVQRFINNQPRVVANCWPLGKTSDIPLRAGQPYALVQPYQAPGYQQWSAQLMMRRKGLVVYETMLQAAPVAMIALPPPLPAPPPAEQLGDLKLYRVPLRTTVAAMQMKQTRLVEQPGVAFDRVLAVRIPAQFWNPAPLTYRATIIARMKNTKAKGLGLPLPAGDILFEQAHGDRVMMVGRPALADIAEGQEFQLELGSDADVTLTRKLLFRASGREGDSPPPEMESLFRTGADIYELAMTNASASDVPFEIWFDAYGNRRVTRAGVPVTRENGMDVIKLTIPANTSLVVRYALDP